jgi:hypothetical protein
MPVRPTPTARPWHYGRSREHALDGWTYRHNRRGSERRRPPTTATGCQSCGSRQEVDQLSQHVALAPQRSDGALGQRLRPAAIAHLIARPGITWPREALLLEPFQQFVGRTFLTDVYAREDFQRRQIRPALSHQYHDLAKQERLAAVVRPDNDGDAGIGKLAELPSCSVRWDNLTRTNRSDLYLVLPATGCSHAGLLPICCLRPASRGRTGPDWASDLGWS